MRKGQFHHKWIIIMLIVCQLFACLPFAGAEEVVSAMLRTSSAVQDGMVRVLLSSMGYPSALDITLKGAFVADGTQDVELPGGAKIRVSMNASTGDLTLTYGSQQYSMGKTVALRRRATEGESGFMLAQAKKSGNLYPGDLYLSARTSGNQWRLHPVAHVYLEYYLYGVVPYEMGSSAPLEALKAQAVAARTFTLRRMNTSNTLYDLTDTTSDQVYYGNPGSTSRCTQAVDETKGIVLMVDNRLAATYYTASNGGQTESVANAWGSSGYTESIVKDDPFDYQSSASTVKSGFIYKDNQHSSQPSALKTLLNQKASAVIGQNATVKRIGAVSLHTPKYAEPSKLYTKMTLSVTAEAGGSEYMLDITCDVFGELESILGISINSGSNELWSVLEESSAYRISARRYGHGIGMSQRGCMQMATLGYTYDQILGFYYNKSYRMQYTFSHTILAAVGNETVTTTEKPADITTSDAVTATVTLDDASSTVNVRAAASMDAVVRGTLPHGAQVVIISNDGTWCEIKTSELSGYIKAEFLVYNTDSEPSQPPASTPPQTIGHAYVNTPSGSLNLRMTPDSGSQVLAQIPRMTKLPIHESSSGWTRVTYQGQTGWVMTTFLTMIEEETPGDETADSTAIVTTASGSLNLRESADGQARILARIPQGAKIPVLEKQSSWTKTSYAGQTGWVMNAFLTFSDSNGGDDTITASTTAVVQGGRLNLRASKSTASRVLAGIPEGSVISVLEKSGDWTRTIFNGVSGWVMSRYLVFDTTGDGDSSADSPTPTPTPSGSADARTAMVIGGRLNLRQTPDTGARILTKIPENTLIQIYESANGWCRTSYQGHTGWVMSSYLRMQSGETSAPTPTPTPENTTAPSDGMTAVVIDGKLNMRTSADGSAAVILRIPEGATVTVLMRGATWSQVQYNGRTGYVMTRYLTFADDSSAETARVATPSGSLNLRETASSGARILLQIPQGSTVSVLQKQSGWCFVRYQNATGYVMTKYLSFSSGDTTGTQTPAQTTATASPTPAPTVTGAPDGSTAWVNVSGTLNLRRSADSDATVLALLQNRAEVAVLERGQTWTSIRIASLTGYVQTQYLTWTKPATEPDGTVRYVSTGSGGLNLRSAAKNGANVILTIPDGASVRVIENQGTWSRISYQGVTGYVQSAYLSGNAPQTDAPADAVYDSTLRTPENALIAVVRSDLTSVNIRRWCSTDAPVDDLLAKGEAATVLQVGETWCRLQLDQNTSGYCMTEYLNLLSAE